MFIKNCPKASSFCFRSFEKGPDALPVRLVDSADRTTLKSVLGVYQFISRTDMEI